MADRSTSLAFRSIPGVLDHLALAVESEENRDEGVRFTHIVHRAPDMNLNHHLASPPAARQPPSILPNGFLKPVRFRFAESKVVSTHRNNQAGRGQSTNECKLMKVANSPRMHSLQSAKASSLIPL
jgi:hypothetical protein